MAPPPGMRTRSTGIPVATFVVTGEVLRIRRIDGVGHLTYKGPKDPGDIEIRQELEWCLGLDDPAGQRQEELWVKLGFEPVAVVRKTRQSHELEGLTVTIDHLDDVGVFAEIERVIESRDPAAMRDARDRIAALANRLGLQRLETRSYLTLTMQR